MYRFIPNIIYVRHGFVLRIRGNNTDIDVFYVKMNGIYHITYSKQFSDNIDDYLEEYDEFDHFDDVVDRFNYIIDTIYPPRIYM
jgi:hypothetical protein